MSDDSKHSDIVVNKFTEESARDFRKKVLAKASIDPNMPIIVYIDSYGGYVDSLNSMIGTMHQVPNPFITVCVGKAMSCGAILLAAGDHRFCDSNARILIHEVSGGSIGPVNELEADAKETRRLNNQMMNFLAKRCKYTYKEIKDMMKEQDSRDIVLTPKKALEWGLVEVIGMPVVKPVVAYTVDTVPERKYDKAPIPLDEVVKSTSKKKVKRKTTRKKTKQTTKRSK